jgi:hypothetical protein
MTALFFTLIQQLCSISPSFQRLLIHLLQPMVLGGLYYIGVILRRHPLSFIGVGGVVVISVIYIIYSLWKEQMKEEDQSAERLASIAPLTASSVDGKAELSGAGRLNQPPTSEQPTGEGFGQVLFDSEEKDREDDDEVSWEPSSSEFSSPSQGLWSDSPRARGYSMDSLRSSGSEFRAIFANNLSVLGSSDDDQEESPSQDSRVEESDGSSDSDPVVVIRRARGTQ